MRTFLLATTWGPSSATTIEVGYSGVRLFGSSDRLFGFSDMESETAPERRRFSLLGGCVIRPANFPVRLSMI
jgi:hypothetical protein